MFTLEDLGKLVAWADAVRERAASDALEREASSYLEERDRAR